MTISTTTYRKAYAGNGATTEFAWTDVVYDDDDILVYLVVDSTGVATLQVKDTDYTIAVDFDYSGAAVTFGTAPATGETVVLKRDTALLQSKDLSARSRVDLGEIEEGLDRLTVMLQDLEEQVRRSVKFGPESEQVEIELPEPEAGKVLQWNATEDGLENAVGGGGGGGSGDMTAAVYDPTSVEDDVFDMANMVEAADAKVMTAAERTKLAGIETGAEVNDTAAEILTKLLTVDGAGSGLDADLLDGSSSAAFAAAAHTHPLADITDAGALAAGDAAADVPFTPAGGIAATDVQAALEELDTDKLAASGYTAADVLSKLLTVDGAGSGLDADLLDGNSSAAFAAAGHNHDATYQPLDADLTSIAALTTTAYGRSLLELADEAALEALLDTLPNLTSIQGVTVTFADAGFDVLSGWDDSASAHKNFALTDITTEAAPAAGDFLLAYGAEGDLRKIDWSDLPGAGGGISNVVEDTTPQLGGDLDMNGFGLTGALALESTISPAQITSTQNDYNPTGLDTASIIRMSLDADRSITGLAGGADGRVIILHNIGPGRPIIEHENTGSTAANRFLCYSETFVFLPVDAVCILVYDGTSERWRVHSGAREAAGFEQEGAASFDVFSSPANQHQHPSANKFWVKAGVSGSMAVSYNMTSVTDDGTGLISGTIATDFSSADWCGQVSTLGATTDWDATNNTACGFSAQAAGTFSCRNSRMTDGGTASAALADPTAWFINGQGDQ